MEDDILKDEDELETKLPLDIDKDDDALEEGPDIDDLAEEEDEEEPFDDVNLM